MKKQTGFTLIEFLLVTALLGILLTLALKGMRDRTDAHKIDKSAHQITQIFQAAAGYFVDHVTWPTEQSLDFEPYLPVNSHTNPWGQDFHFQGNADHKLFKINTSVPEGLAEQLVARLPNASLDTCEASFCIVNSEITRPGQNGATNGINLQAMGVASSAHQTIDITCAKGLEAAIMTSVQGFTMPRDHYYTSAIISSVSTHGSCRMISDGQWRCDVEGHAKTRQREHNEGQVSLFYLAYCQPAS